MITTKYIDETLQRWGSTPNSIVYYGLFINGKLLPVGNKGIYRRAGDLKNCFLKKLGVWDYKWVDAIQKQNIKEMKQYVEDLLSRKIIEIKQL